ncbi:MAG: HIT family protein [Candidatus Paceibacterota bacterium]
MFCKIIRGEIDSQKIYEDDHVFVMLDASPISKGHTLVLPKKHASNILELENREIEPFFMAVKKITKKLEEALSPDGFTHGINHKVGQAIDHLHFHIIPRWKDDGGGSLHNVVSNSPEESLEEIKEIILKKLDY